MDIDFTAERACPRAIDITSEPAPPTPEPGPAPEPATISRLILTFEIEFPEEQLLAFDGDTVTVDPTPPPTLGLNLTLNFGPGAPPPPSLDLPPLVFEPPPSPTLGGTVNLNVGDLTLSTSFGVEGVGGLDLRVGIGEDTSINIRVEPGEDGVSTATIGISRRPSPCRERFGSGPAG